MRLVIAVVASFLISCAQVGNITGGPKDEQAPVVLQSVPQNNSTNFNYKYATVIFDEYIQLRNVSKELIISPILDPQPIITIKNKSLLIDFSKTELAKNTTYVMNFGGSIVDNNESNKLENFQYVFSTGHFIDSLYIFGTVNDISTQKPIANSTVMLYKNLDDTAVYKIKPYYFTKTNANGSFRLNNLKNDVYQIIALKDENSNFLFDKSEAIAFLKKEVNLTKSIDSLTLNAFIEKDTLQFVKKVNHSNHGKIEIHLNQPSDSISVSSKTPFWEFIEKNKTNDTIVLWYKKFNDTAKVVLNDLTFKLLDTLRIPNINSKVKPVFPSYKSNVIQNKIEINKPLQLTFNTPITYNRNKIHLFSSDSTELGYTLHSQYFNRQLQILHEYKTDKSYYLVINSAAFSAIDSTTNIKNDTINFSFKNKTEYGKLIITMDSLKPKTNYIFELINGNKAVIEKIILNQKTTLTFDLLQPGNYTMKLIEDTNQNGKWDSGNFLLKQYPEEIHNYQKPITIRANWDLELDWISKN